MKRRDDPDEATPFFPSLFTDDEEGDSASTDAAHDSSEGAPHAPYDAPPTVEELEEVTRSGGEAKAMRSLLRVTRRGTYVLKVQPLALLIGLSAGWLFMGLLGLVESRFDLMPSAHAVIGVIVLFACALGPRLPERLVMRLAALLARRNRNTLDRLRSSELTFWMLQSGRERDESLLWILLSTLATLTGLSALISYFLLDPVGDFYDMMLRNFFWTNLTLTVLEWALLFLVAALPWLFMGLVSTTLAPLVGGRVAEQRLPPGIAAAVILGLGLSWLVHLLWVRVGWSAHQEYMLGVLPLFLLAALAARYSQQTEGPTLRSELLDMDTPILHAQGMAMIWLCLVIWGVAAALVGSGWVVTQRISDPSWPPDDHGLSKFVLILGMGLAAASWRAWQKSSRSRRTSGCGMAAWAAGVGVSVAFCLMAYHPHERWVHQVAVVLIALPVGYALHYVEGAWLARAGSGTLGFSQMSTALLGGAGLGLLLAHWVTLPNLGPLGSISAAGLLLMAFGGLTQIYEQERSWRTRHQRLALIFASLSAAIVLFPEGVRLWSRWEQRSEPQSLQGPHPIWLGEHETRHVRHICLIGWGSNQPPEQWARPPYKVTMVSQGSAIPARATSSGGRFAFVTTPPMRTLRIERRQYDLIYQILDSDSHRASKGLSFEWWSRVSTYVGSGGSLIVEVPLERWNPEAIRVIAATFMSATRAECSGKIVPMRDGLALRMVARFHDAAPRDDEFALQRFFPAGAPAPVHSISRNRLTPALLQSSTGMGLEMILEQFPFLMPDSGPETGS